MSETANRQSTDPPGRRRAWRKKRWWLLGTLLIGLAALVWLDGHGWRWIAQKAADHYLPELGYQASFELDGRLSGGEITITDFSLSSEEMVQSLDFASLAVTYRLNRLPKGEIDSVRLKNLDATIDLAAAPAKAQAEESPETEEAPDLRETLANLRQRIRPIDLDLENFSLEILDGDETVYQLDPTTLRHAADSDTFALDFGAMVLPGGRQLAAQQTQVEWTEDALDLDRLDLLNGVSARELEIALSDSGAPEISSGLEIGDSRFQLATDLDSGRIEMRDSEITVAKINEFFDLDLPLDATIDSLRADVTGLDGGIETLDADLVLSVSSLDFDGWILEDSRLTASLAGSDLSASWRAVVNGSPAVLDLAAQVDRTDGFLPVRAEAALRSPQIQPILTYVRDRYSPGDERPDPPASSLRLTATASDFEKWIPNETAASLRLADSDRAPTLQLDATWNDRIPVVEEFLAPGLRLSGQFAPETLTYEGEIEAENFASESLNPWLAPFGIGLPSGMIASLSWQGQGDLEAKRHLGDLDLPSFSWTREGGAAPIEASARGTYAWPETIDLDTLEARVANQQIQTQLGLADQTLTLTALTWREGGTELASSRARIPLPDDPTDWRALMRETRAVDLQVETPELPLAKLHPFLPETTRFVPESRGQLEISLTGTPAEPVFRAKIRGHQIALASQPGLPLANLELDALGRDQTLKIDGQLSLPDYPPASLSLVTNWDPRQWAEDPATVERAKLDGSVRISDLDLAVLGRFLPTARRLGGMFNAEVELGGTVAEPEPRATLTLRDGLVEMEDPAIPPVRGGTLNLTATPEGIELANFDAEIAGGTLRLSGRAGLDGVDVGPLDFRLSANSLPVMRNESVIVRASSELTLAGPWETARLAGEIRVVDSLFFKDFEILPIGVPTNQVSKPKLPRVDTATPTDKLAGVPSPIRDWALDIALVTGNPFLIRGNLAKGQVLLDARVRGTVARPRPSGEATVRNVSAELPFSTLEVRSGTIKLRPDSPFDPQLDLRGESTIRPYEINLYISGPVSNPNIQPSSNPPLPQSEILTLLATGTTTRGLEDPQAAAARAAQLVIEEMRRGRIGAVRFLRPVFRVLDNVNFQVGERNPYTSETYNSATFELNDNWRLSAGLSEEGNTRTTVTYLFRFR